MSSADAFPHVPVMRDHVVALLAPALQRPGSVMVDATLGLAGHSEAILTACPAARLVGPTGRVYAQDRLARALRPAA